MNTRTFSLPNGHQLMVVSTTKFKTTTIAIQFTQRASHDTTTARALLRRLLTSASLRYPSLRSFADARNDLYGLSVIASPMQRGEWLETKFSFTTVNGNYVDDHDLLEKVWQFMQDMLEQPLFQDGLFVESYFQERKKSYHSQVVSALDDKSTYADTMLYRMLDRTHALSIPSSGNEEEILALTNEQVVAAYHELMAAPRTISIVGDVDADQMAAWVQRLSLPPSNLSGSKVAPLLAQNPQLQREQKPFQQSVLVALYTVEAAFDSREEISTLLMNAMWGGTALSKLFKVVREEHNYCYSINTRYATTFSSIELMAEIDDQNYAHTVQLIDEQLRALQEGQFTDEEWIMTRNLLINSIRRGYDSTQGIINFYLTQLHRETPFTPRSFEEALLKVTRDDIVTAACGVRLHSQFYLQAMEEPSHEAA